MKESYYFAHDYEPTSDPKISALIAEFGAEGYGIYWRIVEMLHSNPDHKIPKKKYIYIALAKQLITNDNKIELVITYATDVCELFLPDSEFIISKRVLRNFEKREEISEKRSNAGKAGMQARWGSNNKAITNENPVIAKNNKHNKGKENKEKRNSDFSPGGKFENMVW
ncbi:MAG: DUF4373 domain-containing protein [Bacteroidota bacterium]